MPFKALLILILLSSCTAQKRCERKLRKAEKLGCLTYSNDTITLTDTIKGFQFDTVVRFDTLNHSDTLIVEKDGVKTKTIIQWRDRIVSQQVIKQDTIIRNQVITKTKIVNVRPKWQKYIKWIIFFALAFAVFKAIEKK
jgi:hypothetical protein